MFKRYILGNPAFILRSLNSRLSEMFNISWDTALRRMLDLVLSGGALIALAPLIGIIGLAIKLECPGPVFFTQTRVGKNGTHFKIYKFRSMYADAEARRAALLHTSQRAGVCFKNRNDPRVTRVGKVLRRFSLDELPQIFNVFKGQMAIVGPRPALQQEVSAYPPKAMGRLAIKPGLTGLWQVSGRAEVSFDRMINMDLAYAKSQTIFSDIAMIALTFRAVLTGRGAY
jgi:lipopolysaccharide/colanic/teichoic acid biosynthesis glycosyltransferase